ncbi:hypothetical protein TRICI_001227 [Trichomonascus ciferrii]|uniref:Uncharacterized protein n=1 Tax=Trichomonascus ciferrii TaxID=44093 RepID=A0A642V9V1_9ASCO|nr:hypothetical protein TRICI_001227 [Trichomonascus ciferrii]
MKKVHSYQPQEGERIHLCFFCNAAFPLGSSESRDQHELDCHKSGIEAYKDYVVMDYLLYLILKRFAVYKGNASNFFKAEFPLLRRLELVGDKYAPRKWNSGMKRLVPGLVARQYLFRFLVLYVASRQADALPTIKNDVFHVVEQLNINKLSEVLKILRSTNRDLDKRRKKFMHCLKKKKLTCKEKFKEVGADEYVELGITFKQALLSADDVLRPPLLVKVQNRTLPSRFYEKQYQELDLFRI